MNKAIFALSNKQTKTLLIQKQPICLAIPWFAGYDDWDILDVPLELVLPIEDGWSAYIDALSRRFAGSNLTDVLGPVIAVYEQPRFEYGMPPSLQLWTEMQADIVIVKPSVNHEFAGIDEYDNMFKSIQWPKNVSLGGVIYPDDTVSTAAANKQEGLIKK